MRIVSLVDNISRCECEAEHGLSLHIELDSGVRILFDTGQSDLFARNAARLGIDLTEVDFAVISHGHYDHGGGINEFLRINSKAPVYIRGSALGRHCSVRPEGVADISLKVNDVSRLIFCSDIEEISSGTTLFANPPAIFPEPVGNRLLLGPDGRPDDFHHEQSMIIREAGHTVLFGGCAHRGIVNILAQAQAISYGSVTHVLSGFHLNKTVTGCDSTGAQPTSPGYLTGLASALSGWTGVEYYTMHCTGSPAFTLLDHLMPGRINYLSCGTALTL